MGEELKSAFLKMLPVKPEYIVIVSGTEHLTILETNDFALQIRGYIAAKRTSRAAWQRFGQREKFEWTKVTGGIRAWPQFLEDHRRVLDDDDNLTVLTEWGSRKFFDVLGSKSSVFIGITCRRRSSRRRCRRSIFPHVKGDGLVPRVSDVILKPSDSPDILPLFLDRNMVAAESRGCLRGS